MKFILRVNQMERIQGNETGFANAADEKEGYTQYLSFRLGNEIYGLRVSSVKEVIEYNRVFKIPRMPFYIRGVINLRGEVVPVIDLSSRFYGHVSEISISTSIVFIEVEYKHKMLLIGVMIDDVYAVVNITHDSIEMMPDFGAKIRPDFISSIGKVNGEFIMLLNIQKVIDIEELAQIA
jgi:purine-binding chemotaxis protein CheW